MMKRSRFKEYKNIEDMHTVQPEYVKNREMVFLLNENYSKSL